MAIFLAGWQPPTSPLPGMDAPYEYAEYLRKTWGVDVKYTNLALEFTPHPQKPGWWVPASREPRLITTDRAVRLSNHVIGKALQGDRAGFYMAAPLQLVAGEGRPAGVQAEVVAEVRPSEDVWAPDDLRRLNDEWQRNQALRPGETDLKAPFPLAVAATRDGKKVVVFGSEEFLADAIAGAAGLQEVGNTLVLAPLYPANVDLFVNALNWLTGEAERIAPGPRRAALPRLTELTPETAARLPWFLVGAWPALALLAGVVIGLVRRR
jgi:hypothetical protein